MRSVFWPLLATLAAAAAGAVLGWTAGRGVPPTSRPTAPHPPARPVSQGVDVAAGNGDAASRTH